VSGNTVTFGGTPIGTFSGGSNGTNLVVSFNANAATPAAAQALLHAVLYSDNSSSPSTASRSVTFTVVDNGGSSGAPTATLNVSPVPSNLVIPPDVNLGSANATISTFTQTGGLLTGSGTLTVTGLSTFSGGTQSGLGTTLAQGGAAFSLTSFGLDGGRTLQLG